MFLRFTHLSGCEKGREETTNPKKSCDQSGHHLARNWVLTCGSLAGRVNVTETSFLPDPNAGSSSEC